MVGGGDPNEVDTRVRYRANLVNSRTMDGGSCRGRGQRGRMSQENFLPRQAWTEEEEWGDPPDLLRGGGDADTSTSDVTISTSSSESFPERRF